MKLTSLLWKSVVLGTQSVNAKLCQVLNRIVSFEKNEEAQQANLFERQTLVFYF